MKTKLLAIIALLAILGGTASAQRFFSSPGTQVSTNVAYAVAPRGATTTFVGVYGEVLPRLEVFYAPASSRNVVTNALVAGWTNILVSTTNSLTDGGTVLIQDVSANAWQRARIMLPAAGSIIITNDLAALTTSFALAAGDIVWGLSSAGTFPVTAAEDTAWTANGGNVWYSENGPTLFQCVDLGTPTTNQMCIISGSK